MIYAPIVRRLILLSKHTIFHCKRWTAIQERTYIQLGYNPDPNVMIGHMMQTKDSWTVIHNIIKNIMCNKEIEESQG